MSDDLLIGLSCCVVSGLTFGTAWTPFRFCSIRAIGDGLFVQWIMAVPLFIFGLGVNFVLHNPPLQPFGVLTGFIYSSSMPCGMAAVNHLGMGLAMLMAGSVQIVVGWATSRFGVFDWLEPEPPESDWLNYTGVLITVASGFMFAYVNFRQSSENNAVVPEPERKDILVEPDLTVTDLSETSQNFNKDVPHEKQTVIDNKKFQLFYIFLCTYIGCARGVMFIPIAYSIEHINGSQKHIIEYAFSFFCGTFAGATIYFMIYALIKKNRPHIDKSTVMPSFVSGCIWSVGIIAWLISTERLSEAISFPITTRLPGVTAALLDVFLFRVIKTRTNRLLMFFAVCVALIGVTLVGLSKVDF